MGDLKREDGVLVRTHLDGMIEIRAHDDGDVIRLMEWDRVLDGWRRCQAFGPVIGTRSELAKLAAAFPVDGDAHEPGVAVAWYRSPSAGVAWHPTLPLPDDDLYLVTQEQERLRKRFRGKGGVETMVKRYAGIKDAP